MVQITKELLVKRAEHNDGELSTLEEITLHQYDIEKIEMLSVYCKRLRILYLQSNQIMKIEGLNKLKQLEYLNLALNNIQMIEGLEWCESLRKLDLTVNFIDNPLCVLRLKQNEHLSDLFLTGNPCTQLAGYRLFVVHSLPQLRLLDGQEITKTERIQAEQQYARLLKQFQSQFPDFDLAKSTVKPPQDHDISVDPSTNFNESMTRHTPEDRLRTARELAAKRGPGQTMDHLKPKPPAPVPEPTFHPETSKIMQRNDGKYPFKFTHFCDKIVLEIQLPKFMDTSFVDLDLNPTWVKCIIKSKPLYLALDYEILPEKSEANRCISTGTLQITMPRAQPEPDGILLKKSQNPESFTGYVVGSRDEKSADLAQNVPDKGNEMQYRGGGKLESTTMLDVYDERTLADRLKIVNEKAVTATGLNTKSIKTAKQLPKLDKKENFVDDPDVPPLC